MMTKERMDDEDGTLLGDPEARAWAIDSGLIDALEVDVCAVL